MNYPSKNIFTKVLSTNFYLKFKNNKNNKNTPKIIFESKIILIYYYQAKAKRN